jgi:HEAT repeat protein
MNAFEALGATASPAVPELVRMARNPSAMESGNRAVFALGLVGKEGLPPLIEMLESGRMANDATEVSVIGMLGYGVDISSAVPMLLLRHHYYLWDKLKERPDFVVPALTNCLRHPNARVRAEAANALHWLGATARPAVGALLSALQDPDPAVRDAATNALHEITMAASKRSDAIQ